jgi:hypothetical protein
MRHFRRKSYRNCIDERRCLQFLSYCLIHANLTGRRLLLASDPGRPAWIGDGRRKPWGDWG